MFYRLMLLYFQIRKAYNYVKPNANLHFIKFQNIGKAQVIF